MAAQAGIRLVVADVDGTLVTHEKTLTAACVQAVHDLHEAGIAFAVTSGRPPRGMQMLIEPLQVRTLIAGFNGGAYVQPDLSVVETRTLARAVADAAIALMQRQGLDVWLYTADSWFVRDRAAPHVARERWTVKFDPVAAARFPDDALAAAVKIVGVSDDVTCVEASEAMAQHELGAAAAVARSQPYYLDVTHPDANKGAVVDKIRGLLGIDAANVATIGDMPNDVLMFKRCGLSIAMGNASDAVKASASVVTESNEQEGFAHAMRRFVLK
jgi:Cof subfamily protein (haloacid dehalogenase superfamily)